MGLELQDVAVSLNGQMLIRPFSLAIAAGEIVTLMGPSGSGKSTLLSFIAGDIELPFTASGHVRLDGVALDGVSPEQRRIGRLFQDDLLFPHLTVGENLLFGVPRGSRAARVQKMEQALAEAELDGFAPRPPQTLSGGQRARVSLMRALLAEPRAMLLDEPFGKLDAELRAAMRAFVFAHIAQRGIPCLMVTHDRADAPKDGPVLVLKDAQLRHA
ncbi:ATP-binding cassette domain-containing protein [Aestuariivirga sp.]|uniref:ATP-binding cassette domain-containing protein n=1 Tax=Aestuariivirga sp. TaxID=2650926 RepID=UPI003BA95A28